MSEELKRICDGNDRMMQTVLDMPFNIFLMWMFFFGFTPFTHPVRIT